MNIIETLVKIAEKEGVIDCYLDNLKAGDGQGYLGNISVIHLNGKTKCGKEKQLSFVVKAAAPNERLRQIAISKVFDREAQMYKTIFPGFYDFEKEKGIENPFSSVPKCYFSVEETKSSEILILENLMQNGFGKWNRKSQVDDEHVEIVLKEYARFHAVSLAMQDQNPKQFEKLTENIGNIFDTFMKSTGIFYSFIRKSKLALASLEPNTKVFIKYEQFLNNIEQKYTDLIASCNKYFVILHGDSWCNNILFKYNKDSNSNTPIDVRFIDFQFSRLGSPICDLAYFLYPCATKAVLDNIDIYKHLYYDTLCRNLKLLGSNPDDVYPPEVFEEQWKTYSQFGLISSGLINFLLLSQEDEITDFTEVAEAGLEIGTAFDYEIRNIKDFNSRMKCIIEHFVENNLI